MFECLPVVVQWLCTTYLKADGFEGVNKGKSYAVALKKPQQKSAIYFALNRV
jgi:hypothetical protein